MRVLRVRSAPAATARSARSEASRRAHAQAALRDAISDMDGSRALVARLSACRSNNVRDAALVDRGRRRRCRCFRIVQPEGAAVASRAAPNDHRGDTPCGAFVRRSSPRAALSLASRRSRPRSSANTYIFGDSLSDAGQYGARFTTNPGLTFPMYVGAALRAHRDAVVHRAAPTSRRAARASIRRRRSIPAERAATCRSRSRSRSSSRTGPIDPNALYQIQGGANDILVLAGQFAAAQITPAQVQAGIAQAARRPRDAGRRGCRPPARTTSSCTALPDIGLTPAAAAQGPQAQRAPRSPTSSTARSTPRIAATGVQVIQVNTSALLQRDHRQSGAVRLHQRDRSRRARRRASLSCTPATLRRRPTANLTWAFADGMHPTTGLAPIGAQQASCR